MWWSDDQQPRSGGCRRCGQQQRPGDACGWRLGPPGGRDRDDNQQRQQAVATRWNALQWETDDVGTMSDCGGARRVIRMTAGSRQPADVGAGRDGRAAGCQVAAEVKMFEGHHRTGSRRRRTVTGQKLCPSDSGGSHANGKRRRTSCMYSFFRKKNIEIVLIST